MATAPRRTYPPGVTCWVDTEQPDLAAAQAFYGELFGWTFTDAMPPDAPDSYLIASVDGADVAAIGSGETATWQTYIAVDDADATAATIVDAGGQVLEEPADAGPGGRTARCADPAGATFRLWQARARLGAQLTNAPNTWNFSHLRTDADVRGFYTTVFGWQYTETPDGGTFIQVAGYGQHLADTVDPGIFERQANAPDGFADVIGGLLDLPEGEQAHWYVVFTVADRDAAIAAVERGGGGVISSHETEWTREAEVRDPAGARFTVSQFVPPDWF